MISFPNAKINLGLHIIEKRTDGFHNLETVFYPVEWCDSLEIIEGGNSAFNMTFSGLAIPGELNSNLCYKAWQLLKRDHTLPDLSLHLHKVIPMGAGLGGGSSDASFLLKMIDSVCELKISREDLKNYAAQLGSDCAFFIENVPMYASGRGEIMESMEISLKGYHIIIIMPSLTVGTAEAYSWIVPKNPANDLKSVLAKPINEWRHQLINDFEIPVMQRKPEIEEIKKLLYSKGAVYASMSGSGSAVFGIFENATQEFDMKNKWKIFKGTL